jgi:hypothetical protein
MPGPIAVKLRVLRQERGLTQKEAAELANVSPWTLFCLESGKPLRGVGGGVASRTITTVAPISRFPGVTLCANFACIGFLEVELPLYGVLRSSLRARKISKKAHTPSNSSAIYRPVLF